MYCSHYACELASGEAKRIRLHQWSSFSTRSIYQIWTPWEAPLTRSPLSTGCLLVSLECCQQVLSRIQLSSVSMFYQTRREPRLSWLRATEKLGGKNGYSSKADRAGSRSSLSTFCSFGDVYFSSPEGSTVLCLVCFLMELETYLHGLKVAFEDGEWSKWPWTWKLGIVEIKWWLLSSFF